MVTIGVIAVWKIYEIYPAVDAETYLNRGGGLQGLTLLVLDLRRRERLRNTTVRGFGLP